MEGRAVRWRCDHHAGLFRVGDDKHGQTEVICMYGKRHQVMSGFLAEAPVGLDDETFPWIKGVIRGVQLLLQFRGRALQIGNS